jgi:glycerate dehydrogenase
VAELSRFDESTPEEIVARVAGQEIVITKELPVPGELIARFSDSVRLICEAGTGYNNIDLAAAKAKRIAVCNAPAYSTDAVAQLVITFVLNFSASLIPQQRMLWQGNRDNFSKSLQLPHFELAGKVLGLIGGSGAIGSKVAELALALGMEVLISSRTPKPPARSGVATVPLEELLERSDFVSIHCPLTAGTRHLIDRAALEKMKPSAFLINTARGAIVREADLIEALQRGTIAGAGLDVQDPEPPAPESPLYTLENVILTPHIGWKRLETRQRLMDIVAGNVAAFIGGRPVNLVD